MSTDSIKSSSTMTPNSSPKNGRKSNFRVKQFQERESLFRVLYESKVDAQSLYGFVGGIVYFHIMIRILDHLRTGSLSDDFSFLHWSFCVNFLEVWLVTWILLQTYALACYYLTKEWVNEKIPSHLYYPIFVSGIALSFYIACRRSVWEALSPTLRSAIVAEQIRIGMKVIAFTIESSGKREKRIKSSHQRHESHMTDNGTSNLNNNSKDDEKNKGHGDNFSELEVCSLSHYIYFLFVPTLVFRDRYAKSSRPTNWNRVVLLLVHFIVQIYILHEVIRHYARPYFQVIGTQPLTFQYLLTLLFVGYMTGAVVLIAIGYGFLHCWMNIWAEILSFGDRQFYLDWWNQTNGVDFLRTWNLVIGEWIFEYVYIPMVNRFKSRTLSALLIYIISAILHDYVCAAIWDVFIPVFTLTYPPFGILAGVIVAILHRLGISQRLHHIHANTLLHMVTYASWSMWLLVYGSEHYSRRYCSADPSIEGTWKDVVTPRFLTCVQWEQ